MSVNKAYSTYRCIFLPSRDLTRDHRLRPPRWPSIFSAFGKVSQTAAQYHVQEMTSLMTRHCLSVPANLQDLMRQGFPCQCRQVHEMAKRDCVTKGGSLRQAREYMRLRVSNAWNLFSLTGSHHPLENNNLFGKFYRQFDSVL
jgi:hypothetical protein